MEREILFRGKRSDNGKWVEGALWDKCSSGCTIISGDGIDRNCFAFVIPETVGQLRHKNSYGSYFDGDVYYHAGHGNELVSGLCELHEALLHGNDEDICDIKGNIHDNPELLKND